MDENLDAGMVFPEEVDVFRAEHLVDAAVALPQDDAAVLYLLFGTAAELVCIRIPDRHLLQRDAHAHCRVAAKVLIGKEHHAARAGEGPFERRLGVAAGANDAAMAADECFEARRRVDVGDRRDVFGVDHLGELIPRRFNLANAGHVGHRTAGS